METGILIGLLVALVAVLIGFVFVPIAKNKGWLKDNNTQTTKQVLRLAELILNSIDINDTDLKNKTLLVIDVAEIAVRYVEQVFKFETNAEKKRLAKESILRTLKIMKIEVTPEIEEVIELGIESMVNQLPKTYDK